MRLEFPDSLVTAALPRRGASEPPGFIAQEGQASVTKRVTLAKKMGDSAGNEARWLKGATAGDARSVAEGRTAMARKKAQLGKRLYKKDLQGIFKKMSWKEICDHLFNRRDRIRCRCARNPGNNHFLYTYELWLADYDERLAQAEEEEDGDEDEDEDDQPLDEERRQKEDRPDVSISVHLPAEDRAEIERRCAESDGKVWIDGEFVVASRWQDFKHIKLNSARSAIYEWVKPGNKVGGFRQEATDYFCIPIAKVVSSMS